MGSVSPSRSGNQWHMQLLTAVIITFGFFLCLVCSGCTLLRVQSTILPPAACAWVSRPGVSEDKEGECKNYSGLCSFTVSFVTMSVGNVAILNWEL